MNGFLLIDKPAGPTSHDIVDKVRRLTGERTVGHAGTLDPFATGLLIIGVGREATKHLSLFLGQDKEYEAIFTFGASSDTDDRTGTITPTSPRPSLAGGETKDGTTGGLPTAEQIRAALPRFTGAIQQIPPAFAAIKIKGKKMYEAARAGKPLEAPPRKVMIYKFELLNSDDNINLSLRGASRSSGDEAIPEGSLGPNGIASPVLVDRVRNDKIFLCFHFRIHCSSGTYIRALARDLGKALGTAAYVSELRRTSIGPISIAEAASLEKLTPKTVGQFLVSADTLRKRLSQGPAPSLQRSPLLL